MKRAKVLVSIPLLFVTLLLVWAAARSSDNDPNGEYPLIATINPPALSSFDISWADSQSGRYFLADRVAGGVDVYDAEQNTFLYTLGAGPGGFVGNIGRDLSGPNGIVVIHKGNRFFGDRDDRGVSEVWGGDGVPPGGVSSVKVIDLESKSIVASISTGGNHRADELAYDSADKIILIANDADTPAPFLTFISASGDPDDYHVLGKIVYDGKNGSPLSTGGIEQPARSIGFEPAHPSGPSR